MNSERNLQPSLLYKKENDLNQTSRELCSSHFSSGVGFEEVAKLNWISIPGVVSNMCWNFHHQKKW